MSAIKKIVIQIRNILISPINNLQASSNVKIAIASANLKLYLKGMKLRVGYNKKYKLFSITDRNKKHYFGSLLRGLKMYSNGLDIRAKKLFDSYLLNNIKFEHDDFVVDCGANYADLWLSLEGKIKPTSYITFEPGIVEHKCVQLNAPNGTHNCLGLDNKVSEVTFYVNERFGDSSLVEPPEYTHTIDVNTTTLESYITTNNIHKIKLFKLEAEGYEPEILDGAKSILGRIDYIAIDGGYERGLNEDETFTELNNTLLDSGFELIARHKVKEFRALYKNKVI